MPLPPLNIAEAKKTDDWIKNMVFGIASLCTGSSKSKDEYCYRFYNGTTTNDFEYLNTAGESGEYVYPASIRWVPIIKPKLQYLRSRQSRRPFTFKAYASDRNSLKNKLNKKAQDYIQKIEAKIQQRFIQLNAAKEDIERNEQQLINAIQQEPQNEQQIRQRQSLILQYEQLKQVFALMKEQINSQSVLTKEEIEEIERYHRYDSQDHKEELAQKGLIAAVEQKELKTVMQDAFDNKLITGKPMYWIEHVEGEHLPRIESIDSLEAYWDGSGDNRWIQNGQWCARRRKMTLNQIVDYFKSDLDSSLLMDIQSSLEMFSYGSNDYLNPVYPVSTADDGAIFKSVPDNFYNGSLSYQNYDVVFVYFKSPREISIKKTPNKYIEGQYITHFIPDIPFDELKIKESKGEKKERRYVNDIYHGVLIGNKTFVRLGKVDESKIFRDPDTYEPQLPLVGESFNKITKEPYSLCWETKDIQIKYNLMHYHEDLMLALAGVKGIVMDLAQMPGTMSKSEWLYNRKMGITFIDSQKRGSFGQRAPSFNQFQNYDDTVSNSIATIDVIKRGLIELAGDIIGVNRPAQGQVVPTDQVGTFNKSVEMTNMVTEVLFHEFDTVTAKALEMFLNVCTLNWNNGSTLTYTYPDLGQEVVEMVKNVFKDTKFSLHVVNNLKEESGLNDMKQWAMAERGKGTFTPSQVVSILNTDNLKELEKKLQYYSEEALKIAQKNNLDQVEADANAKKELLQLEHQMELEIKNQEFVLDAQKNDLEKAKLELLEKELSLKKQIEDNKNIVKTIEIDAEQNMEYEHLKETKRSNMANERLDSIELALETILTKIGIDTDEKLGIEKLSVEKRKNAQQSKEHISDN